jgi:hypothetical protein
VPLLFRFFHASYDSGRVFEAELRLSASVDPLRHNFSLPDPSPYYVTFPAHHLGNRSQANGFVAHGRLLVDRIEKRRAGEARRLFANYSASNRGARLLRMREHSVSDFGRYVRFEERYFVVVLDFRALFTFGVTYPVSFKHYFSEAVTFRNPSPAGSLGKKHCEGHVAWDAGVDSCLTILRFEQINYASEPLFSFVICGLNVHFGVLLSRE